MLTNPKKRYIIIAVHGVMAQLVERLVRNEEASGSNPLSSTTKRTAKEPSFFRVELIISADANSSLFRRFAPCVRGGEHNNVFYFAVYENYYIAHFFIVL